jgi:hypothetical protein
MNQDMINQLIEQALREFEQEQYNHVPEFTHAIHLPTLKTGRYYPVNQQIYAQKYMPFDAISWPTPIDL